MRKYLADLALRPPSLQDVSRQNHILPRSLRLLILAISGHARCYILLYRCLHIVRDRIMYGLTDATFIRRVHDPSLPSAFLKLDGLSSPRPDVAVAVAVDQARRSSLIVFVSAPC
jgi:hypothetical protein